MKPEQLINEIIKGALDARFEEIYGSEAVPAQRVRYTDAIREFSSLYGEDKEISLFSVPGRSELSGNHTDHNRGRIIAGSVNLDIIAVASKTDGCQIRLKSAGFPEDRVDLDTFTEPDEKKFGHSDALIAGVADGMKKRGYAAGGFCAYTTSSVLKGSGLSSSAAFEDMVGTLISHFYNDGKIDFITVSQVAQYAENAFFGKPCGLMDQLACAAGGAISVDFGNKEQPVVEKLDFDFNRAGYRLCIVNTGGNHADLTPDYAAVPAEMKAVAAALGKEVLREVDEAGFINEIPALRAKLGDRAVMRAMHFFEENRRVAAQAEALGRGDLNAYFAGVTASGLSSCCYLQNVYTPSNIKEQGLSLALCLCDRFVKTLSKPAAFRLQGGGFAGTIQIYLPEECTGDFRAFMEPVFGENSVYVLRIRNTGATRVF